MAGPYPEHNDNAHCLSGRAIRDVHTSSVPTHTTIVCCTPFYCCRAPLHNLTLYHLCLNPFVIAATHTCPGNFFTCVSEVTRVEWTVAAHHCIRLHHMNRTNLTIISLHMVSQLQVTVAKITCNWYSVVFHPCTYYRASIVWDFFTLINSN